MIANIHLLSNDELQHLLLVKNKRFSGGIDSGMNFFDFKEIRTNLREITGEQHIRKSTS